MSSKTEQSTIPCTVGILTYNNATTLGRALESVEGFAEVIVCDGGSDDDTLSIAQEHGARVITQDSSYQDEDGRVIDFAGVMNQLVESASAPWFYKLDSDECLSDGLRTEVRLRLADAGATKVLRVPFKYVLKDVVIEQATTYPASEPRLFRVDSGLRYERPIHERLPIDPSQIELLSHPHLKPLPTATAMLKKWVHYMHLEAEANEGRDFREWRETSLRQHWKSAKYLTWRYSKILRSRSGPRLPARYELLRITNDLVAIAVTGVARVRRKPWSD